MTIQFKTPEQEQWYKFYEAKAKELYQNEPRPFKKLLRTFSKQQFANLSVEEMKEFWREETQKFHKI